MALYINKQELIHRLCNGFVTHDGYIDGEFFDIFAKNGINIFLPDYSRMMDCVAVIVESMESEGVQIYPKNLRGSKIREIRKQQGKSVNWVALKAGLSKTTIYDIEYGLTKPRQLTLEKIAKALKVDIEALG